MLGGGTQHTRPGLGSMTQLRLNMSCYIKNCSLPDYNQYSFLRFLRIFE